MSTRAAIVAGLGIVAAIVFLFLPPIPQDPHYHQFADQRTFLGIPHFWNVVSNAPFVLAGLAGLVFLMLRCEDPRFIVFFIGVTLTGIGSAYYHADPTSARLFWDRLPLTTCLMSLFAIVIRERTGARLLIPLLLAGVGSMLYWQATDDLRPYALVQFYPILAIPLLMALFPPKYTRSGDLAAVIAGYAVAKALELLDGPIYHALGHQVSGHTLKHIAASVAALWVLVWIMRRKPIDKGDS